MELNTHNLNGVDHPHKHKFDGISVRILINFTHGSQTKFFSKETIKFYYVISCQK
jgi:hypothetical protein